LPPGRLRLCVRMAAQEQPVPFMLSRPLNATYRAIAQDRRLRNFDIFDFALNATA
jgi:phosphonoacetate hydrolase